MLLCLVVSVRLVGLKLGVRLPMSLLFCLNLFLLCLNLLVLLLLLLGVVRPLLLLLMSDVASSAKQQTSKNSLPTTASLREGEGIHFVRG